MSADASFASFFLRAVLRLPAGHALQVLDDGIQRTVGVIRRAPRCDPDVVFTGHLRAQCLDEPRLAKPGLALDKHDLSVCFLARFPRAQKKSEFLLSPNERQSISNALGLGAAVDVWFAHHAPSLHRNVDALEAVGAEVLAGERFAKEVACERANHHLVRTRQRLQAGSDVRGLADHARLHRCAFADDVADNHGAGVDADTHRQLQASQCNAAHDDVGHRLDKSSALRRVDRPTVPAPLWLFAREAPMRPRERVAALKRLPILASLSEDALERVAQSCVWRQYDAGEQILGYEEPSTDVSFLLTGKARAIIYSSEGRAVVFTDLKPGAMFGEIAAIDRKPRSASIEALEPCTIASLSADKFESLMLSEPSVAVATLRHVTAEVRRLSERVFEFSTMVVQNRIHAELLRLADEAGQRHAEVVLSPAPSLSDIANRISTHREAVSRELSRLSAIGLLRREGGDLRITNLAKLVELVDEAKGD